jgi:predicted thioredoxin/glutaredoxin
LPRILMYIHPTCATSYHVVKHLARKGLLDRVELTSTANPAGSEVLRRNVWSVPWILVDGVPAATDPVEPEEAEAIITGSWKPSGKDPVEAFMETVLHSAYAAAAAYLHDDIAPVLDTDFASAATRAPLSGANPESVISEVRRRGKELWEEWRNKVMRALGISFVREYWWASGGSLAREELKQLATPTNVGAWLIAKASIGRSGLPSKPFPRKELVEDMARFVQRGAAGLLSKIRREQEEILNDEEYWRILSEHGLA